MYGGLEGTSTSFSICDFLFLSATSFFYPRLLFLSATSFFIRDFFFSLILFFSATSFFSLRLPFLSATSFFYPRLLFLSATSFFLCDFFFFSATSSLLNVTFHRKMYTNTFPLNTLKLTPNERRANDF